MSTHHKKFNKLHKSDTFSSSSIKTLKSISIEQDSEDRRKSNKKNLKELINIKKDISSKSIEIIVT